MEFVNKNNKRSVYTLRRFLSWIVLYLISCLISLLTSFVVGVGFYILDLVNELSTFLKLIIYLFGGTTFLSFIFLPVYYGSFLTVSASEAVKNSRKGLRYIVFSVYMLITNIIYIIVGLTNGTFHLNSVIMCIYYILLIILGHEMSLEDKKVRTFIPDHLCQSGIDEITHATPLTDEEKTEVTEDIKSTKFVTLNLLSPLNGHSKQALEVTDENRDLISKWLHKETNSVFCLEVYKDGEPEYYYTTKDIFDNTKINLGYN